MKLIRILILMGLMIGCGRAQIFSKLYDFSEDKVGAGPILHLVQGPGGKLYGETFNGHGNSYGTVFAINADGTGFTNIFSFNYNDGAFPKTGGLILSGNTLYGTTYEGANGYGTVFAVDTDGTGFTNLFNFSGSDGSEPEGDLVLSGSTLYGTTAGGGTNSNGIIFEVQTNGTGFTNLYNFDGRDGSTPEGGMVISGTTLYGTTYAGGTNGDGSVFAINMDGTGFTNLFSFANYNGYFPLGNLTLSGHALYGTTLMGGSRGYGEVFGINTDGTGFTNLYSFTNSLDGGNPEAGLVLSGRTLYGTAEGGGTTGFGDIFAIHTDSSGFTNLYSFTNGVTDGAYPSSGVILSGSTLYGTASGGGTNGEGTIFSLTLTATPSLPALGIQKSGQNLIVSWPSTATGYTLMAASGLGSASNWSAVTNPPVIVNSFYTVTNVIAGQQMFYYLSH